MEKNIAIISGDGTGPEVIQQAVKVLDSVARQFKHVFSYRHIAIGHAEQEEGIEACRNTDAILSGSLKQDEANLPDFLTRLKRALGFYVGVTPVIAYPAFAALSPLKERLADQANFIVVYPSHEERSERTEELLQRVIDFSFEKAGKRHRRLSLAGTPGKIAGIDFISRYITELVARNKKIIVDYLPIEQAIVQILVGSKKLDVVLTDEWFSGIITAQAGLLVGSAELLATAYYADGHALFQPVNKGATGAAGKNVVNPVGAILAAALMLDHFGLNKEAEIVREAIQWTIINGFVAKDLDAINNYSTSTIGELVSDYVEDRIPSKINRENITISKSTII